MKKKLTAMLLAAAIAAGAGAAAPTVSDAVTNGAVITASASSEEDLGEIYTSGDYSYYLWADGESAGIVEYTGSAEALVIPSTLDGHPVREIYIGAFMSNTTLRSVTIPDGVLAIDGGAFDSCTSLSTVSIPDSMEYIGNYAFCYCPELKIVTIPKSVEEVGKFAFGYALNAVTGDEMKYPDDFKLKCYPGTAGEKYAKDNGIDYELIINVGKVKAAGYSSTTSTVTIKWDKVENATGYRIYKYDANKKKWITVKDTAASSKSFKLTKLKAGTTYKYKVKAFNKTNGRTVWGAASDTITTATCPSKPTISKVSKSKTAVRVYWKKVTGASGYKLQQYDSAAKKWKTVNTLRSSVTNYKVTGLEPNTAYKFRIQAYKNAGGQKAFSSWSATKKATTKK